MKWITPFLAAAAIIAASGCATKKPNTGPHYTFFPGIPDPPRLQFLTSFGSERDLRGDNSAFATFITGEKPVDKPIGKPYGVALHNKKIYVCDSQIDSVLVLDLAKRTFGAMPVPDDAGLAEPLNIAFDTGGVSYLVDDERDHVICLGADGQVKWVLGKTGEMSPRDVVASRDRLYVGDVKGHCIRAYDKQSRDLLFTIPRKKDARNGNAVLLMPSNLALDESGQIYASDTAAGRVEVYDRDGYYVRTLGGFGDAPEHGLLKRPKGVAVDRNGIVYVVDSAYELVQMFDSQGRYLMCFGYPGSSGAAGMTLPAKVTIDYDDVGLFAKYVSPDFKVEYLVIVTNQFGSRKVAIYGFGHQK